MARALLDAIYSGNIQQARDIINENSYGCIDSQTSRRDGTALFFCCCRGYLELATLLISKNAKVNAKNKCLATPLHAAADNNHLKIVRLLLDHGADIDAQTHRGDTPLHLTAFRGHADVAQLLVERGANYLLVNESSINPAVQAMSQGFTDLGKYLNAITDLYGPPPSSLSLQKNISSMGLVDIRPPSPSTSPNNHQTQPQSFQVRQQNHVNNATQFEQIGRDPGDEHSRIGRERISTNEIGTGNFPNQSMFAASNPNQQSSLNLKNSIRNGNPIAAQRSFSSSDCERVSQQPGLRSNKRYNQKDYNTLSNRNFSDSMYDNDDNNNNGNTIPGLSIHPSSYNITPASTHPINNWHQHPGRNTDAINYHNFSNHHTYLGPLTIRPGVTQQQQQYPSTAPVFNTETTNGGFGFLTRIREPEESIDDSMIDLPLTSKQDCQNTSKIHMESQLRLNIPMQNNMRANSIETEGKNKVMTSLSKQNELNKHIYHRETDSKNCSLMSTESRQNSVYSTGSDVGSLSGDARRDDFDLLSSSIPFCHQPSYHDGHVMSLSTTNNKFPYHLQSPPVLSLHQADSLLPSQSLCRVHSTPSSIEMGSDLFDSNRACSREPSPSLRAISPMSLEPLSPSDSLSGSRFMETSTKLDSSEHGSSSNNDNNNNINNRTTNITTFKQSKGNNYIISSEQSKGKNCCLSSSEQPKGNNYSFTTENHIPSEFVSLNEINREKLSLNDLSLTTPKKKENSTSSLNFLNIPV